MALGHGSLSTRSRDCCHAYRLQRDVGRLRVSFGSRASSVRRWIGRGEEGKTRVKVRDDLGLGLSYWIKEEGRSGESDRQWKPELCAHARLSDRVGTGMSFVESSW